MLVPGAVIGLRTLAFLYSIGVALRAMRDVLRVLGLLIFHSKKGLLLKIYA